MLQPERAPADQLAFAKRDGNTIVYVSRTPDIDLTRVYNAIRSSQGDKVARECIRLLQCIQQTGTPWTASVMEVRQVIEHLLSSQYDMRVRPGLFASYLQCGPKANPATAITVLARLKLAFRTAIELGFRVDQPMETLTCPRAELRRHDHLIRNTWMSMDGMKRSPVGYYRVEGKHVTPVAVMNNPELPQLLRDAVRQLGWSARDYAVLELLLSTGARVTEVCGATWGGVSAGGFQTDFRFHNKGQGLLPRKAVTISPEANAALLQYCTTERIRFDPLQETFQAWNRGRTWTPERYLQFLHAKRIHPSGVSLFLSERKTPFTADAFNKSSMRRLRTGRAKLGATSSSRIVLSAHHIRHWYINAELARIAAAHHTELQYVMAVQRFVSDMGWRSWNILATYDHDGTATKLLKAFARKMADQQKPSMPKHGLLATSGLTLPSSGDAT